MTRRVFYSFQYKPDVYRVSQVRNIGKISANEAAKDNDWETLTKGGEAAITRWISDQMIGRSCTVVLVGQDTANRKWINHEICKSWDKGMGVVGIRIHGLKNSEGKLSKVGGNPFDYITHGLSGKKLSSIVNCYSPIGSDSKERYAWIAKNMENAIEEAIKIRKNN